VVEYGRLTDSSHDDAIVISPEDFARHMYILGGTGSGKTSLVRVICKHLECANYTGVLASSMIYVDVKDEDALLFLRQCEERSFHEGRITYVDLNRTGFAINLLELPPHDEKDKDATVSRMVGHVTELFKEFYSQSQTYIQMERILRLLLFYLYSNIDSPTLVDLYNLILRLQRDKNEIKRMMRIYGKVTGPEMKGALESVATISKDSWVPLLNRIEMFATDPYMRGRFAVRKSMIDFERMLEPGNITIFRISGTQTPRYAHGLAIMAVVIKIWFAVQERAARMVSGKRPLAVLALDEFQRIRDLSVITSILSQARAFGLGLVLSHQNLAQLDGELLETIVGNSGTQIYGRVSGIDASKVARIMDPYFAEEVAAQIAVQPDYVFTARMVAPAGGNPGLPIQFRAAAPPSLVLDETQTEKFINKMTILQKSEDTISVLDYSEKSISWMESLDARFLSEEQWTVLLYLQNNEGNLRQAVMGTNSKSRKTTKRILDSLVSLGLADAVPERKIGQQTVYRYCLSEKARSIYFPVRFERIGRAFDVDEVASFALAYYIRHGCFVGPAQFGREGRLAPDMVVYDYSSETAISVEIESKTEADNSPEQVRFNMTKWRDLGFGKCHVWSKSRKVEKVWELLGDEAKGVMLFIMD
jgi:hypothetical protein